MQRAYSARRKLACGYRTPGLQADNQDPGFTQAPSRFIRGPRPPSEKLFLAAPAPIRALIDRFQQPALREPIEEGQDASPSVPLSKRACDGFPVVRAIQKR